MRLSTGVEAAVSGGRCTGGWTCSPAPSDSTGSAATSVHTDRMTSSMR
ncbi:hypothetical protein HNR25_000155 [Streptomonospora salina]|uniref:Uncharacterized protein n=1 Tax=Streptomonospora salina TaxID=104205 RepID=A0A841E1R9_9ACTN|nr:hypothetical protein [Streptomonospora salina]MBB5996404.1 hypothetical protein [Streptomonospora salina]